MPDFRAPGMAADRQTYVRRAVLALIGAVVLALAVVGVRAALPDDAYRITMHTDSLAGGIETGTGVVVNGSEMGKVESVSADEQGQFSLGLALDKKRLKNPGIITSTTRLTYAPKNLFGISAVVLNSVPGGDPVPNGGTLSTDTPVDATLTSMLRQLSDMQGNAFEPYVGDLIAKSDQASMAMLPVLDIVGRLSDLVVETESIPADQSLPQLTGLIKSLPPSLDNILTSLKRDLKWPAMNRGGADFLAREKEGLNAATTTTMDNLGRLLGPTAVGQLMPLMPQVQPLLDRILESSPNARKNGLQIRQLIYNLNKALPTLDGRPVLKVDVVLRGMPGPTSALTGGVR
ncbi:MlaD family protein [Gordonia sp. (in: high G+C Gram-positive bacteria)]|uniref:MlaD family protein n=1 Tax=Gordonia sp. (in: high G+C Gram-positive bacteria) TaxID=84139 RepID=UPI0039E2AD20